MTAREQGFLLLTGYLGDPDSKPLSIAQLRNLTLRARTMERPLQERELTCEDLIGIGCDRAGAQRILRLLSRQEQLQWYVEEGKRRGCYPITRVSGAYPDCLRRILGTDAPGALWAKGNAEFIQTPMISLVGSRELRQENYAFACELGKQAALQGFTLVSGNARGADRAAQDACLAHGGRVISIVADELASHAVQENVLYLSEEGYELSFSAQRALQRNRVIHCLGEKVFVAQSRVGKGGTWSGTLMNLRKNWRPVFCFADGSTAANEMEQMGAVCVTKEDLSRISALRDCNITFIDP